MTIRLRRRATEPSKQQALRSARKATARLRRIGRRDRKYQSGKQESPAQDMTPNQMAGGLSG